MQQWDGKIYITWDVYIYIYATSLVSGIFSGAIKPYSLIYVSIYICNH